MNNKYLTIKEPTESLFKDKGSRFLAFAFPIDHLDDVKMHLNSLKESHPKAVHHCYAYRFGEGGQEYRANDDGEPSGSAGRPILGQIDSMNLNHVLVVVVRYFGGTLLGVPGLINAYKNSTFEALSLAEIIEKIVMQTVTLDCDYSSLGEILNIIKNVDGEVDNIEMLENCHIQFKIPKENIDILVSKMEKFYEIKLNF